MPPFSKWKVFLSLLSWHSLTIISTACACVFVAGWLVPPSWWLPTLHSDHSRVSCAVECGLPAAGAGRWPRSHGITHSFHHSVPQQISVPGRRFRGLYDEGDSSITAYSGWLDGACWKCAAEANFISSALWWALLTALYIGYYCRVSVGRTQVYFLPTPFNSRLAAALETLPTYDANSLENTGSYLAVPTLTFPYSPYKRLIPFFTKLADANSIVSCAMLVCGGLMRLLFDLIVTLFAPPTPSGKRRWGGAGYVPTPFLTNPNFQTLFAAAGRPSPKAIHVAAPVANGNRRRTVSYDRELVQGVYADGEICVLDWSFSPMSPDTYGCGAAAGSSPDLAATTEPLSGSSSTEDTSSTGERAPVIILFHGLTGGSDDSNLHFLTKIFNLKGWHVVIPVRRGCAEENITITGFKALHYAYGDKKDTELAVRYISRKMRGHPLFACGISAGSNVMCNYLAKRGDASRIRGGVSIANGFCWNRGTAAIRRDHPVWDAVMSGVVYTTLCKRHSEFFEKEARDRSMATFGEAPAIQQRPQHHQHTASELATSPSSPPLSSLDPAFLGLTVATATLTTACVGSPTTPLPVRAPQSNGTPEGANSVSKNSLHANVDTNSSLTCGGGSDFPSLQAKSYKANSVTMTSSGADLEGLLQDESCGSAFVRADSASSTPSKSREVMIRRSHHRFPTVQFAPGTISDPFTRASKAIFRDGSNGSAKQRDGSNYSAGSTVGSNGRAHSQPSDEDCDEKGLAEEFRLGRISSMQEYDAAVSRRVHGYNTLEEFYRDQSCVHNLNRIRVPTVFLNALDDPLSSKDNIPYHLFTPAAGIVSPASAQRLGGDIANPHLVLVTTPSGGHLGWADAMWPFAEEATFMDRFIVQALSFMIHEEAAAIRRGTTKIGV